MPLPQCLAGVVICVLLAAPHTASAADDALTLTGVADVSLLDAGVFLVSGPPQVAREEVFEILRRPDGGVTLLATTTMADGAMRVMSRYDYDARWHALSGAGRGLYDDEAVNIHLNAVAGGVAIQVHGEATVVDARIACASDCLINMAPSASPMFVMTRRYDRVKAGTQTFQWAAQDLSRARTSPDNQTAELRLRSEVTLKRADSSSLTIRAYEMVERIPTPDGGVFVMEFDLWTDDADRPMGFRINRVGGRSSTSGAVGFRRGFEDIREQLAPTTP